ncbi:MAG TPA: xanthine dehydrogenase family protein molybdopterin-binding subunit [Thermoanaerobaculia bacterium]|nr:xanthine dehydrogenase family protein molybdopterin-binding subunit [Thermoanaerobaculia bacterium]
MSVTKVNRREFVKLTSAAAGGLLLGLSLPACADDKKKESSENLSELGAFVQVATDGTVTIFVSKSDMGQGVRTTLPMIVAEELDADWKKVKIRQASLDKKFGRMGTGGSSSTRTMWMPLRQAGATARAMLVSAAAAKWGVDPKQCAVANGVITSGTHKAHFGEVAAAAAKLEVPKDVALKDPAKFTIIGRKTDRLDNTDNVLGNAQYGIDVKVPGMLYGAVLRAPVFGARVASFDATKAKAMPGVREVVKIDATPPLQPWAGVGVVADSTWQALKARDAIEVKWDTGKAAASETSASLRKEMDELVSKEGKRLRNDGDVDAALASAAKKLEASYEVPYLAHAPMEPMNATVSVTSDGAEAWLPTQFADWSAGSIAEVTGLKPEQIKVHVTLLGGGFGRRAFPDFTAEATHLSKAAGKPVHVQWTREDDMQHDYYRPHSVHRLAAGLDADGHLVAYRHRFASAGINAYMKRGEAHESEAGGIDDLPHAIPNFRLEYAAANSVVPRGWWRSVENSGNAFVVQSFLDEAAHAAGKDPIEFQLAMLPSGKTDAKGQKDYPFESDRLRHVIELVRDRSAWGKPLPAGHARGFAAWWSFVSYVAEVAEVSIEKGEVRVHRVTCVVDCGTPVNPDGIAAQMEGGIVYGLTAALGGEITIDGGRVVQSNFHEYPLLTIRQMPVVDVHIVPSTAKPTGTGEPGLPPIAPAVTNAIFAATGKRIRRLPIDLKA